MPSIHRTQNNVNLVLVLNDFADPVTAADSA
jgi:hypothetical protein